MIFVSFLDFEKITQIIGIFTLIVIIMVLIIAGHSLIGHSFDFEQLNTVAKTLPTNVPNIWVSVLNYFAICVMTGVSMVFVLGGSIIRIGVAEKGGTLGGAMVGLIIAITSLVLFVNVGKIASADIPMLVLANEIGLIMLVVLLQAWIREKGNMQDEKHLRRRMISLISKKYDDDKKFTKTRKIK